MCDALTSHKTLNSESPLALWPLRPPPREGERGRQLRSATSTNPPPPASTQITVSSSGAGCASDGSEWGGIDRNIPSQVRDRGRDEGLPVRSYHGIDCACSTVLLGQALLASHRHTSSDDHHRCRRRRRQPLAALGPAPTPSRHNTTTNGTRSVGESGGSIELTKQVIVVLWLCFR